MPRQPLPPGPPGHLILGHLLQYRRDPLTFLSTCARDYGDIAYLKIANYPFFLVSHPDYVEQILVRNHDKLKKDRMLRSRSGRELFGNGLLVSSGEHWRRQRQIVQPAFRNDKMEHYAEITRSRTQALLATWREGEIYDMHAEMSRLILGIAGEAFFGADVAPDADHVVKALIPIAEQFAAQGSPWSILRRVLPTPARFRYHQALARLNKVVYDLIDERRRRSTVDREDLLSMLIQMPQDGGQPLTDQQVRDEVMTFFLAGHETTALAVCWTLLLLARNPEVQAQVAAEASRAREGAGLPKAAVGRYGYLDAVLKESLRLYPPVWILARAVTEAFGLGGFEVAAGMQVVISPWIIHRDPRFFDRPEQFDPSRWSSRPVAGTPRYAYLPFGVGPRACVGQSLAMMEAALILAAVSGQFTVEPGARQEVVPMAGITLRPGGGVPLRVQRRKASA